MNIDDVKKQIWRAIRTLYFGLDSEMRADFIKICEDFLMDTTMASSYKRSYENGERVSSDSSFDKRCLKVGYLEYVSGGYYMVTKKGYDKACQILKIED